jgi:membrane protease YdiL (CAAX protease family)
MNDEDQNSGGGDGLRSDDGRAVATTTFDEIPGDTAGPGSEKPPEPPVVDPDRPRWGPVAGILVWLLSVGSTILIPALALSIYLLISIARGMPAPATELEVGQWAMSPGSLVVQVWANLPAHVLTVAVCWLVVSRSGARTFLSAVGWGWAGRPPFYWVAMSGLIIVILFFAKFVTHRFLPEAEESPFDVLLSSTFSVKLALAAVAVISAPFVEELVYRGVLYAGLRSKLGPVSTIIIVTLLFSAVHGAQYRGKWASMADLTLLSLALTMMRTASKSVLPSVMLHLIFNAITSVFILVGS